MLAEAEEYGDLGGKLVLELGGEGGAPLRLADILMVTSRPA